MEILRTERLMLRDFVETDLKAVYAYASDPEVVRYMDWGPNTEEDSKSFVQQAISGTREHPRKSYTLAIILKSENELIGGCGIYMTNLDNREGYIGYCLNRNFWARGYGTETAKALLNFGFETLDLHRIFATCDVENIASVHVLEKVGMRKEAHFQQHKWVKGKWRDSLLYAILDHEWKQPKLGT
jgi:RimJ/RimL family protein N-acetyltransferase